MFKLTEEEKAKFASGEWTTMADVIAARLSASANANTDTPEELDAVKNTILQKQADVNPDLPNNPEVELSNEESEEPSMWSHIADFISGVNPFGKTGAGTSMAGWTRYNGSASPIAAAYNSWLQNKQNRMADVAKTAYNADLQKEITKLNNDKASENLDESKAAEIKAKQEIIDDSNFKADQAAYSTKYNQIESDISKLNLELKSLDPSKRVEQQMLKKRIDGLEADRKNVLKNMSDNADSYGRKVSKRFQDAFDTYLADNGAAAGQENKDGLNPPQAAPEAPPQIEEAAPEAPPQIEEAAPEAPAAAPEAPPQIEDVDANALRNKASRLEAKRSGLGNDWKHKKDIIAFNNEINAFNDLLDEKNVSSDIVQRLKLQPVPEKPQSEIDANAAKAKSKRDEWVDKQLKKLFPYARSRVSYLAKRYDEKKAELEKEYDEKIKGVK